MLWTSTIAVISSWLLLNVDIAVAQASGFDVLDYIDPLIGTVHGGHVFPGATLPFGMAKAVADVNTEIQGGFASDDGEITGFSHMHDSGTGGVLYLDLQYGWCLQTHTLTALGRLAR
jgi:putative alpha-1,2-mannosidase